MSDVSEGPRWWHAVDGKWYPPERHPDYEPPPREPSEPTDGDSTSPATVIIPETNGMAIAALAMSILGYLLVGFGTLFGIAFGVLALHQLRRADPPERGRGLAVAALILSLLQVALVAVVALSIATVVAARLVTTEINLQLECGSQRQAMKSAAAEFRENTGVYPTRGSRVDRYLDSPVYYFDFAADGSGEVISVGSTCRNRGFNPGGTNVIVPVGAAAALAGVVASLLVWRRRGRRRRSKASGDD